MEMPMVLLNGMSNDFKDTETVKIGLEYLRQSNKITKPLVMQNDEGEEIDEEVDEFEEDEYDETPLAEDFSWYVAEQWFYSVFFIGIFGIFVYVEMPLDILAMP